MIIRTLAICAVAALAACGEGNPITGGGTGGGGGGGGGGGTPPATNTIPAALARNLNAVSFNQGAGTLTVNIDSFDANPFIANYTRSPGLDVTGFQAYRVQETALNRPYIALFAEAPNGTAQAGSVSGGGFANRVFGGTTYARIDVYSPQAGGLATYIGSYAGTFAGAGTLADPLRTTGTAIVSADFNSNQVEGVVTGRTVVGGGPALTNLALIATSINTSGEFLGTVENPALESIGTYGGTFGGAGAQDVVAVLVFTPISGNPTLEYGALTAASCTSPAASAACP